jgi:sterol desaturase/sphingolipid hydroxylase (fatty acid hydroxylase superfamily)
MGTLPKDYIAFAFPVFLALIAAEAIFSAWAKRGYYRFNDSVNDLSMGAIQQLVHQFLKVPLAGLYFVCYARFHATTMPANDPWVWAACFVGVDFCYYWFHRTTHEVAFLWATHIPHHQSEEFNLSVALRQGAFHTATSVWFYLPLAAIGFPPEVFAVVLQFNTLYSFWVHTRCVGKLGFLESFMNTPSHHRVHHGKNPEYLDKNHGGTLIIWDKLFGTFAPEVEEPVYGIVKPLASWNPLWANVHYWKELVERARQARGWDKVQIFLRGPGWSPAYMGGPAADVPVDRATYVKYGAPISKGRMALVVAIFLALNVFAMGLRAFHSDALKILASMLVVAGLCAVGALMTPEARAPRASRVARGGQPAGIRT